MDLYAVTPTEAAKIDTRDIVEYIQNVLQNHTAAKICHEDIVEGIKSLDTFPLRHRVVEISRLTNKEIRMMSVGNYLLFYVVDERKKVVVVLRVLHATQDWLEILQTE